MYLLFPFIHLMYLINNRCSHVINLISNILVTNDNRQSLLNTTIF